MNRDHSAVLNDLLANFTNRFNSQPKIVSYAPGRVEVLGNHTDYNEGFVLSAAIDSGTYFLASPTNDGKVTIVSQNMSDQVVWEGVTTGSLLPSTDKASWSNYIKGVLAQIVDLAEQTHGAQNIGFNALFGGDLALGAGLSSSAALEVCSGLAISRIYHLEDRLLHGQSRHELAKICQRSEHLYVGVKCGLLDQFSSLYGKTNCLVLSDFRTLDVTTVPLGEEACFLICNTNVHHNLVGSEYNVRRESCERAVKFFAQHLSHPVTHLRDVSWAEWNQLSAQMDPVDAKRSAHPIGEDERVIQGKQLLDSSDKESALQAFGKLMLESHESSRVYFENSCRELDEVVEAAKQTGKIYGARLSGGGFGGSAVILVHKDNVDAVKTQLEERFKGSNYQVSIVKPSGGAAFIQG